MGVLILVVLTLIITIGVRSLKPQRQLPPGPNFIQLIWDVLQFPHMAASERIKKWSQKYGPILSFGFGTRTMIVLGNRSTANALFVRKSPNFSNRPDFIFLNKYIFKSLMPIFMPYDHHWQAMNRERMVLMSPRNSKAYRQVQSLTARYLLFTMLQGGDLGARFAAYAQNLTSTLLYGTDIGSLRPIDIQQLSFLLENVKSSACLENVLVDVLPFIENLPGVSNFLARRAEPLSEGFMQYSEKKLESALQRPSWNMASAFRQLDGEKLAWKAFCVSLCEIEIGASATTPMAMSIITKMIASHPQEARKLQAEIDRVVGTKRLPTFDDLECLPGLQSFVKESLRLRTIAPLNVPHSVSCEDEYMGYRIPKGALIFANQWAMNMDESVFEDPLSFKPERWLLNPSLPSPSLFGFGKRACPGQTISTNTVSIAVASMIWAFDFDDNENTEKSGRPPSLFDEGPQITGVRVRCRSPSHAALIEREWLATNPDPSIELDKIGRVLGVEMK